MLARSFKQAWFAVLHKKSLSLSWEALCLRRESNPHGRCGPQDFKSCVSTSSTTKASVNRLKKNPTPKNGTLERKTGLEPATPTLARSCSTKWATFACIRTIFRSAKIRIQSTPTKFFLLIFRLILRACLHIWSSLFKTAAKYFWTVTYY